MSIRLHYLSLIFAGIIATAAGATDAPDTKDFAGSKDHPMVLRFKDSKIIGYVSKSFDDTIIPMGKVYDGDEEGKKWVASKSVEGKITRILYVAPADAGTLEVERNYENALATSGFTIVFKCDKTECGKDGVLSMFAFHYNKARDFGEATSQPYALTTPDQQRYLVAKKAVEGGDVYVDVFSVQGNIRINNVDQSRTMTEVEVVEPKGMGNSMVKVDADAIASALESSGKISLNNLYFDTAKATLKSESGDAITQITKALTAHPQLKIEIDGHTDNSGTTASNATLSQRRAESVRAALIAKGIDASRLTAKGFGQDKPIESNDTEEGRAKNRRVELIRK